jgi:DNA mismatch repair protein MutL
LGKLIRGIKTRRRFYFWNTDFSFEEVVRFVVQWEEVEQTVNNAYQIHKKYIVSPIKSGMVVVDQQRAHQRVLYEQF